MEEQNKLLVFISHQESVCGECNENPETKAWVTMVKDKGALCLSCADLDHLVFLSAGNAALSRRARKHSTLSAIDLKWSRARKRYDRQDARAEEAGKVSETVSKWEALMVKANEKP